jgi:glycosyltransferase involved in cell wall biosynthesis
MKVGFIIENYYPSYGGPYSAIKETIKELSNTNKIKIKLICRNNKNGKNNINLIKEIKNLDICHFYGGWTFFYLKASVIAIILKKKIIFHPFGIFEPWSMNQKKIKKKIAWFLYQEYILKKSDLIHCVSDMEKKNLLKLNRNFKTIVLPYGISSKFITTRIKKNFKKQALFFSRLHPKKGLSSLIKAWIELNDKNWVLDIVGPCENRQYYNRLSNIIKKNNSLNINLLNPVFSNAEKKKLFDNYDFFVLPTKNDPFGIVILESLARGLPVLTNDNTPWSTIKSFNAGWFIHDNYLNLKLVLKKVFNTPKEEFYLKSKNAIELSKNFEWKILSKEYISMYKNLLN